MYTMDEIIAMEAAQIKAEYEREPDADIWRWSPLPMHEFDEMLNIAHQVVIGERGDTDKFQVISFGEAGSGIGTKLWWAKNKYNMMEYGYEINDDYLHKAFLLDVKCERRDLAELDDQPVWAAYDIVYIARPFKDDIFESQWERTVMSLMRPGAVLISAYAAVKPYQWTRYFQAPFRGVWRKPSDTPPRARVATMSASIEEVRLHGLKAQKLSLLA